MDVKRGDIVIADLSDAVGSEQGRIRPAVIIQNNTGNLYSPTTIIVPLTSQLKKAHQATHAIIRKTESNGLKRDSMALCEQVRAIDKAKICGKVGFIDDKVTMEKIFEAYISNFYDINRGDSGEWNRIYTQKSQQTMQSGY